MFLTFFEYQICLVLGITSWLFAITAYQKSLFHNDFPSFLPSNILVETCWHLQFLRYVVRPFSYLFHVLYIEFDLLLPNNGGIGKISQTVGGEDVLPQAPHPQYRYFCSYDHCVLPAPTSVWEAFEYPQWVIIFAPSNKNCLEKSLAGFAYVIYISMPSKFSVLKFKICFLFHFDQCCYLKGCVLVLSYLNVFPLEDNQHFQLCSWKTGNIVINEYLQFYSWEIQLWKFHMNCESVSNLYNQRDIKWMEIC